MPNPDKTLYWGEGGVCSVYLIAFTLEFNTVYSCRKVYHAILIDLDMQF